MRWGTQDRVKVRKCECGGDWQVRRSPAGVSQCLSMHPTWQQAMKAALKLVGLA